MRKPVPMSCLSMLWTQLRSMAMWNRGDRVVITAGVPLGISGTTNLMKVDTVK